MERIDPTAVRQQQRALAGALTRWEEDRKDDVFRAVLRQSKEQLAAWSASGAFMGNETDQLRDAIAVTTEMITLYRQQQNRGY